MVKEKYRFSWTSHDLVKSVFLLCPLFSFRRRMAHCLLLVILNNTSYQIKWQTKIMLLVTSRLPYRKTKQQLTKAKENTWMANLYDKVQSLVDKTVNLYNFFCDIFADLVYQNIVHKYTCNQHHVSPSHATVKMSVKNKSYHSAHNQNVISLCEVFYEVSTTFLSGTNYYTLNSESLLCACEHAASFWNVLLYCIGNAYTTVLGLCTIAT